MILIAPVFDRIDLLPFYLRFYARRGITSVIFALWNGVKNPLYRKLAGEVPMYGLQTYVRVSALCSIGDYNGPAEVDGLNRIRQEFVHPNDWYVIADLDEFVLPAVGTFPESAQTARQNGYEAVHGVFIDRMARGGATPDVDTWRPLDEQFPLTCAVSRACGCNCDKVSVARGDVAIQSGHHGVAHGVPLWRDGVAVHHFKWTSGVKARTEDRFRRFSDQGLPWTYESKMLSAELGQSGFADLMKFSPQAATPIGV